MLQQFQNCDRSRPDSDVISGTSSEKGSCPTCSSEIACSSHPRTDTRREPAPSMLDLGLIYVHYMTGLGLLLTFWELLLSSSLGILDPFIGVPRLQEIAEELLNTCIVQPCLQFAGSKMLSEFRPSKGKPCGGWASSRASTIALARGKQPLLPKG